MGAVRSPFLLGRKIKWWNRWQVQGGEALNWPKENGQTSGGQRKGKGEEVNQIPGNTFCLRLRSSSETQSRQSKVLEPAESNPFCYRWGN